MTSSLVDGAYQEPNSARSVERLSPDGGGAPSLPPPSPDRRGRFKSRASSRGISSRTNSLRDTKVLLVTDSAAQLIRTNSIQNPDTFGYSDHFQLISLVGRTERSEVWKVQHRISGELFAIKRQTQRFKTKLQRERCLREIKTVAALPPHPNVVGQYRAWQEGGHFHIQMDFCEGGSLQQLIQRAKATAALPDDVRLWQLAWDVASGLDFLASHHIMHLDIKPDNLYLTAAGTCRIGDFGLAVANEDSSDWEEGDGAFVAPELLQAGSEPTSAADIFSLGATLYECATGEKLARQEGTLPAEIVLPDRLAALQQLVRSMLQSAPEARPSAAQVLQFIQLHQPHLQMPAAARAAAAATTDSQTPLERLRLAVRRLSPLAASPFESLAGFEDAGAQDASMQAASKGDVKDEDVANSSFSFDVPQRQTGAGLQSNAMPLLQQPNVALPPASTRKPVSTPLGLFNQQRWAPELSPIIGGLTPPPGAPTPPGGSSCGPVQVLPPIGQRKRPPPLQLPPSLSSGQPLHSNSTLDSRDHNWLKRRDILSPDSDLLGGNQSDGYQSESYSGYTTSCTCTVSELDFADMVMSPTHNILTSPISPEFMSSGDTTAGPTPHSATPELFHRPPTPTAPAASQPEVLAPAEAEAAVAAAFQPLLAQAPSLAWDLHTSPEFLMQLPPGSVSPPASLSRSSSMADGSQASRSLLGSVRQKLLDSMQSLAGQQDEQPGLPRLDSLAAMAGQPLSARFEAPPATLLRPSGLLRKRQHSSRRQLISMLSQEASCASSLDLQPALKTTRPTPPYTEAGTPIAHVSGAVRATGNDGCCPVCPVGSHGQADSAGAQPLCAPMTTLKLRD